MAGRRRDDQAAEMFWTMVAITIGGLSGLVLFVLIHRPL